MDRLRSNIGNNATAVTEKTETGEVFSTELDEGALHDVFAAWLGYQDIPMQYLDGVSIMVPVGCLILVFYRRDVHTWTKCCTSGALLAVCKGLLACMTVVPDSTGWSHCKARLGEQGVKYFKDPHNMNTIHMLDFVRDLAWLESGRILTQGPTRFCADMVYSGHTYFTALFSLGFYDIVRKITKRWSAVNRRVLRVFVGILLSSVVMLDVVCILMNRFHYSMDVFLALLITALIYTNGAIAIWVAYWAELWIIDADKPPHRDKCGGIDCREHEDFDYYGELMIPPCCVPFCTVDGSYYVHYIQPHGHGPTQERMIEMTAETKPLREGSGSPTSPTSISGSEADRGAPWSSCCSPSRTRQVCS